MGSRRVANAAWRLRCSVCHVLLDFEELVTLLVFFLLDRLTMP